MISLACTRRTASASASSAVWYRDCTSKATSFAPPCFGPRSAPMPPVMAEYMSEPVPAITRQVNVLALYSCSA